MKKEIFDKYVDEVTRLFGISKEQFFTKNKKRDISEARQVVYYLCYRRPMQITYIEQHMRSNGYDVRHPTIIHGIKVMTDRVDADKDYYKLIERIEKCIQ